MLIHHAVQKGQSTRLSAKRAFSNSREPDMPSIVFRIEMSNDAASGECMEIMNLLGHIVSQFCYRCKVALSHCLEAHTECEETSGKEPLGEHVFRSIGQKDIFRNLTHHLLEFLKVGSSSIFHTVCITENKVTEGKFFLYII